MYGFGDLPPAWRQVDLLRSNGLLYSRGERASCPYHTQASATAHAQAAALWAAASQANGTTTATDGNTARVCSRAVCVSHDMNRAIHRKYFFFVLAKASLPAPYLRL